MSIIDTRTLTLGHSPDSDDAFMFHGLANHKIDTEGLHFEHILRDIQTLNVWAKDGKLDTTAISIHAYTYVQDKYAILAHGSSVGDMYGPMIVATTALTPDDLVGKRIAIPGRMTTAYLTFQIFMDGRPFEAVDTYFQDIMQDVLDGKVDAGLIIHEGQLTHRELGLHTVLDLGVWWQETTDTPLPLGVNVIRRDLGDDLQKAMSRVMRRSIEYSLSHRSEALEYALTFARDMPSETADKFVGMYVNNYTLDLGERGKRGVELLLTEGAKRGISPLVQHPVTFVD
jgi:1,4-dihydroxy-6-naphthoate synthase